MLPVLPFLIGGALGTVAGVAIKKYYDENDTQNKEKLEDGLMNIEEWLDEKLVVLDRYKDSLMHISELPDSDAGVVPDTFAMRFSRV